ncbi:MAG: MopE-related protein [Myxococcota bacterium]
MGRHLLLGAPLAVALAALTGVACSDAPARDNPFDQRQEPAVDLDPHPEVAWRDGALEVTWSRIASDAVVGYRVYRSVGDGAAELVVDLEQPNKGDAPSWRDARPFPGGAALTYRVSWVAEAGESARYAAEPWRATGDLDGDGYSDDDCGANVGAMHPGAPEVCNGLDDDCDGVVDDFDAPCEASCSRRTCTGGAWSPCVDVEPAEEVCNGLDDDCDGGTDEAGVCGPDCPAGCDDGEVCVQGECVGTVACASDSDCPDGLGCAEALGVCAAPCGATGCPEGRVCVADRCLAPCAADDQCPDGFGCVFRAEEPVQTGGCAASDTCASCADDATCLAATPSQVACCEDGDDDGFFALACPYGSDCDDGDGGVWDQCALCETGADCASGQCVLLGPDEGLCGGPAGCHCPAAAACAAFEDEPRCWSGVGCLEQVDCDGALGPGWACEPFDPAPGEKRCICVDPTLCPACLLDAECPDGQVCEAGRCEAP